MVDIVEESWNIQHRIESRAKNFGKGKYGRVLKMARKPENDEYIKVLQITSIGLILMGGLGFLIYWLWTIFPTYF
ncbi:MAG: protein translocase SEC61 complex subunit gamma [Thermoplasmata archaeon]|nr:protein translocase SEC61 complex subunit gamma [Thermoplasmata archaeon]